MLIIWKMTNLKEQYIKCAIQNGLIEKMLWEPYEKLIDLEVWEYQVYFHWIIKNWHTFTDTYDIIRLITSKEFIEAISKRAYSLFNYKGVKIWNIIYSERFMEINWSSAFEEHIATEQALAIRDWKLDDFIKNILNIKD